MTPAQKVFRFGAIACGVLALLPGYWALRLRWVPAADFDVIGFLWLFQNLPRLMAVLLAGLGFGAALYFAVRSVRG